MGERWENQITAWRKKAGLTMEQLGHLVEPPISKGMISQYEAGKRKPRQDTLEALAIALGTTPGKLIDMKPDEAVPAEIIDIWSRIPEDRRSQAAITLESFANQKRA